MAKKNKDSSTINTYYLRDGDNKTLDKSKYHKNFIHLEKYCIENYLLNEGILEKINNTKNDISILDSIKETKEDGFIAISSILNSYTGNDKSWIDKLDASAFIGSIFQKLGYLSKEDFIEKYIDKVFETKKEEEIFNEIMSKIFFKNEE